MNYSIKVHDELPLVHTHVVTDDLIHMHLTLEDLYATTLGLVYDRGYGAPSGYQLSDADAYARRLAEEAEAWLRHACERSRMKLETITGKALQSLAFTMRHRAHDLAVPTKLSGTSKHQKALWQLTRNRVGFGAPLDIEEVTDAGSKGKRVRLVASYEGETLGEVQSKHVGWLRPLLPFGAGVWLIRITGHEERYTLGVNVAIGRVGGAVVALNHALGHDHGGDGYGGDGAAQASPKAAPIGVQQQPNHGGDGARGHLRLVSPALLVAKPQAGSPAADDVVLYRDIDGTARATVNHVVRHSPTGIEWGYHGSGPADLARSVLLAFTDEAMTDTLYQAFKAEVIVAIPKAGGVIRAADVRAWLAAHGVDAQR